MSILNDVTNVIQVWSDPVPAPYEPVVFSNDSIRVTFTREGQLVFIYCEIIGSGPSTQLQGVAPWLSEGFVEVDSINGSYFYLFEGDWTVTAGTNVPGHSWTGAYTTSEAPAPDPGPGTQVPVYTGYAPSGAVLPYIVTRPLDVGLDTELNLDGSAVDWNTQISAYCCAASVEASFNLALAVIGTVQGARVQGTTLAASMGYNGAEVEGHYESQVTVQLNQGGF